MPRAPSEQSHATVAPISAGSSSRPSGTAAIACALALANVVFMPSAINCRPAVAISVSTQPGQMALTVMRRGASSSASAFTKPSTPCLLAQYAV